MVDDLKAAATSKQFVAILEAMLAMLQVGCSRVDRPSTGVAMTVCTVQQTLEFPTNAQQFPRVAAGITRALKRFASELQSMAG